MKCEVEMMIINDVRMVVQFQNWPW